jgi:hypothetical protein
MRVSESALRRVCSFSDALRRAEVRSLSSMRRSAAIETGVKRVDASYGVFSSMEESRVVVVESNCMGALTSLQKAKTAGRWSNCSRTMAKRERVLSSPSSVDEAGKTSPWPRRARSV